MHDADKALMAIGFSDYEARAYCALLAESPANGYQIAKQSGIPRAKIYECLDRLVARGAVVRLETSDPDARRFAPTSPNQLIDNLQAGLRAAYDRARDELSRFQADPQVVEVLWRVTSQKDLIARGRSLCRDARQMLHVALWSEEFDALLPNLLEAAGRGLLIALVLYSHHPGLRQLQEYGVGAILHSRTKRQAVPVMGRQFALVADRERCITGSIFSDDAVEGVFTMNRGLVTNAVDLVNHEIYLERIMQQVGQPVAEAFGKNLGKLDAFDSPLAGKKPKALSRKSTAS